MVASPGKHIPLLCLCDCDPSGERIKQHLLIAVSIIVIILVPRRGAGCGVGRGCGDRRRRLTPRSVGDAIGIDHIPHILIGVREMCGLEAVFRDDGGTVAHGFT